MSLGQTGVRVRTSSQTTLSPSIRWRQMTRLGNESHTVEAIATQSVTPTDLHSGCLAQTGTDVLACFAGRGRRAIV